MTIEEGRDVAAILRILCDSFSNSAVDNGMIDSLILMDKPIAQPGAFGEVQGKGNREHFSLRCFDKGVIVILGWRACQLNSEIGVDVNGSVDKELEQTFGRVSSKRLLEIVRIRYPL